MLDDGCWAVRDIYWMVMKARKQHSIPIPATHIPQAALKALTIKYWAYAMLSEAPQIPSSKR